MHPLVGAVLRGLDEMKALVLSSKAHPPDIELGEAVDAGGGEGDSIVDPDRPREAVRPDGALDDPPSGHANYFCGSWPRLDERLRSAYKGTVLTFQTEPPLVVELHFPLRPDDLARLLGIGLGATFAVITACNPNGKVVGATENQRRTKALRAHLHAEGTASVGVTGASADQKHDEPGFACALSPHAADALARHWQQVAFFWFEKNSFWLAETSGDRVARSPEMTHDWERLGGSIGGIQE